MNTADNYRYPGSRPFQDTDLDRLLFFGREKEKQSFLHLVLAENLVVLFAKSGMGKSSLLNAGLLQSLRERDFIPLKIRVNDPEIAPLQTVYSGIKDTVEQQNTEYTLGEENTLWQYFKTVEFWSAEDVLLTPVLILDQFEDFFTLHPLERRKVFITQLADLIKGRIPLQSEEEFSYGESPPNVKIIISIREDFLGQLEEMSHEIPDILQNRFRLLLLNRGQARQAIVEPSKLENERIQTKSFCYAPETVEAMLDFLCKQKVRDELISTDEVEPFQLQLLCQHIENIVREKPGKEGADVTVEKDDLGGKVGMQRVLQNFYNDQIKQFDSVQKRKRVQRLCEKGLISGTDRRLSLEEEEIEHRFKVSKDLLAQLVNSRLLRAEPRVGSVYYELSHDTLVEPIRKSQYTRKVRKVKISGGIVLFLLIAIVVISALFLQESIDSYNIDKLYQNARELSFDWEYDNAIDTYNKILEIDKNFVPAYIELIQLFVERKEMNNAIGTYQRAIDNNIRDKRIDEQLERAFIELGQYYVDWGMWDNVIEICKKAIENDIQSVFIYHYWGKALGGKGEETINRRVATAAPEQFKDVRDVYREQQEFTAAIEKYNKALEIDKTHLDSYKELAILYIKQGKLDHAIDTYQRAVEVSVEYADIYKDLAKALKENSMEEHVEKIYEVASKVDSKKASYYFDLGNEFRALKNYERAIENNRMAVQLDPEYGSAYHNIGVALGNLGRYDEAIKSFEKAITLDPDFGRTYTGLGIAFYRLREYDKAFENFQKAIQIDPNDPILYEKLGDAFVHQDKYEEALEQYRKAIEINPNRTSGYNGIGYVFKKQAKYDEAIEYYQKAIEIDPEDAYAYAGLGRVFLFQGKYDEANASYEKAIKLSPENVLIKINFAEDNLITEQFDTAFRLASEIAKADNIATHRTHQQLVIRFISISSLFFQGKRAEAFADLKELLEYYKSVDGEYERIWNYGSVRNFISTTGKLPESDKTLLLTLIDILESPKLEAAKKLEEFEDSLGEMFNE